MATLEGNAQHNSINTICKLNTTENVGQAFAIGSADKSIRIYKVTDQSFADASSLLSMSGRGQNVDMIDEQTSSSFTPSQLGQL